jgi:molecular chaperone DnaK
LATQAGPVHLDTTLTRAEFETVTSDVLDRCKTPIKQVIKDAEIKLSDISHVILVGGSMRMPAVGELVRQMTGGKRPYRGLIPEGIVTGAALEAGVLAGKVKDVLTLDVNPLSLGIETSGGIYTKLIQRNTTIPIKRSELFTTNRDNQNNVTLHIMEGELELAQHNSTLAIFELAGLAPAPKGIPQIEIAFDINANGILNVSAKDLGTGRAQSLTVNRQILAEAARRRQPERWSKLLENVPDVL